MSPWLISQLVHYIYINIYLLFFLPYPCNFSQVDYANPNMYMNVIIGVSTFLSFYGHLLFYKATKKALPGYGLRAKFVCIIVVLVLCGLQSGILETMGALEVVPCTPPFSVLMRSQRKCTVMEVLPHTSPSQHHLHVNIVTVEINVYYEIINVTLVVTFSILLSSSLSNLPLLCDCGDVLHMPLCPPHFP